MRIVVRNSINHLPIENVSWVPECHVQTALDPAKGFYATMKSDIVALVLWPL